MHIQIPYGKSQTVNVQIPDRNVTGVFSSKEWQPLADERAAIAEVLTNPVGTRSLVELAHGKRNAVIAVTDASRPNIEKKVLPLLVEKLTEAGIPEDQITVLIGPGSHRAAYEHEVEAMLGELSGRIQVVCHSAFESPVKDFGRTSFGHPVQINRQFAEADFKVVVGTVLPHPFAGFSGGGKMISVGIASAAAISFTHSPEIIDHPCTGFGVIEGNPFYLSSLEQAELVGVDFLVNGIMDEEENLYYVNAGSVREAHLACINRTRELFEVEIPEKVDIVVCSTGYPKDSNLYHVCALGVCAVAGSAVSNTCLREGGTMIMASPMEDGVYNKVFYNTLKEADNPAEVISRVQAMSDRQPGHHRAYGVAQVLEKYQVVIAQSAMEPALIEAVHIGANQSLQAAIDQALAKYGEDARVAVLLYSHRMILQCRK